MEQNLDGKSVAEVMAITRAGLVPAIAHELAPIVGAAGDRELAQHIAREAAIAAARAIEPALQCAELYLKLALKLHAELSAAEKIIATLAVKWGNA
jgi:hypothetical protein